MVTPFFFFMLSVCLERNVDSMVKDNIVKIITDFCDSE